MCKVHFKWYLVAQSVLMYMASSITFTHPSHDSLRIWKTALGQDTFVHLLWAPCGSLLLRCQSRGKKTNISSEYLPEFSQPWKFVRTIIARNLKVWQHLEAPTFTKWCVNFWRAFSFKLLISCLFETYSDYFIFFFSANLLMEWHGWLFTYQQ